MKFRNLKKIKELKTITTFLKPKKVYIPLISQDDKNITLLVKKGDYVFKGSIIGKRKGNLRISIHSSVSGIVVGFSEHTYLSGQKVKCVEIENDYKEKEETRKTTKRILNKYTKEEFINLLRDCGIVGLDSGFPTYVKYQNNINTLIVNSVNDEPYVTCNQALFRTKCEEILEAIDSIMDICSIEECFIAIKKDNIELKKILDNHIGTYLKIKVVEVCNDYASGWERNLVKKIKHETYKKYPTEKSIVVNNVSTIYAIYEALKYNKALTDRVITITGDGISKSQNILVKNGTLVSEIIESIGGMKKYKKINFIAGGLMMGNSLPSDDLVVTSNLNSVFVIKECNNSIEECIRCGKCVEVCPVKLSPILIKDNINNPKKLEKLKANRCINCGLCSYICPAKINVRDYVKEAKKKQERI